jgi:gliding motility-associated lipoprotein GldH
MKKIALLLLIITFISSCSSNYVFNESFELPQSGWYKENGVKFEINIDDTLSPYDFSVNIRNNIDYRYSNLYVFMITEFPNGNLARDTIEFILADRQGKWLGKGWGSIKENDITLNKNMRFPLVGKYKFIFQQAMRTDTLKGINNIGVNISKANY